MKKRVLASILAGVLTVGVLTGCGSKTEEAADTTATEETTEDAAEDTAADAEETDAAATETKGTITVAASATPHAEILFSKLIYLMPPYIILPQQLQRLTAAVFNIFTA